MGLLSWLMRRGDGPRAVTEPSAQSRADAGTTTQGPDTATDAGAMAGWRLTPPVQRTLSAPMGLVTDPVGFGQRLGTWQDPTVTGPLGHLVSAQAPSGVGHGLAAPTVPVQRTAIRPEARAFGDVPQGGREPAPEPAWAYGTEPEPGAESDAVSAVGSWTGDGPGDPGGTGVPTVSRSVSRGAPDGVRVVAPAPPAPLPVVPLQRFVVPSPERTTPDPAPSVPATVMRVPSVPADLAGATPARPLTVAEPPDVPVRELAAVPAPVPDGGPGPMAPEAPAEPVAGLLAEPGDTDAVRDEGDGGVVQRTEAAGPLPFAVPRPGRAAGQGPDADRAGPVVQPLQRTEAPVAGPLPPGGPRPGTAVGQGPDAVPTAPLIGDAELVGPVLGPLQRTEAPAVAPLPPAVPRPGRAAGQGPDAVPTAPLIGDADRTGPVLGPLQRTETPAAAPLPPAVPRPGAAAGQGPDVDHAGPVVQPLATPAAPPVVQRDVLAPSRPRHRGLGEPLSALPPTALPLPGPATAPSAEPAGSPSAPSDVHVSRAVEQPQIPRTAEVPAAPDAPAESGAPAASPPDGEGTAPLLGDTPPLTTGPVDLGTGPAPETATGADAGSGDAGSVGFAGPVAVQRLDVPGAPPAPPVETGQAPLLGDAGSLAVSDTAVPEAPGPGQMVTASTPMPLRRLDTVDDATLPGVAPQAGVGVAPVARGGGPVLPLVAQRSLPLYTVPDPSSSAAAPVVADPPAAVPIRWEPVGGGPSRSGAGRSDDRGGPGGGDPTTSGGSAYPAATSGNADGVVQRAVDTGTVALAGGAPAASSYGEHAGAVPGVAVQPSGRALPGSGGLGPAAQLQRLAAAPGVPSPLVRPAAAPPGVSAGAAAVAAGVARWMADGSVEFTAPALAVQRAEVGVPVTEPPPADPPAGPEPTAPSATSDGAGTSAAPTTSATPGNGGGSGTPKVTDELVRALVAPLSRLLKAELRIERERTGSLINTRH